MRSGDNKKKWISETLSKYITYEVDGRRFYNIQIKSEQSILEIELNELFENGLNYAFCLLLDKYFSYSDRCEFVLSNNSIGNCLGLHNSNYSRMLPYGLTGEELNRIPLEIDGEILNINRNVYPEYNSLKKTIKDFRKKDISQTFDNIKAFESFYIDSDESEETQKLLNENFINYLNQLIEKIESDSNITLPTPQAWKSYVQYYTHVPKSIKYRIDKVLRDIEKYGLV